MTGLTQYLHRMWRAQLAPTSLLSEAEVLDALPTRPGGAREWLLARVSPCGHIGDEPVYRWGDVLEHLGDLTPTEPPKPVLTAIASWRAVARILKVSEDTVARHRKARGDRLAEPWFEDADAVVAWWRALHEPPPLRRTGRR